MSQSSSHIQDFQFPFRPLSWQNSRWLKSILKEPSLLPDIQTSCPFPLSLWGELPSGGLTHPSKMAALVVERILNVSWFHLSHLTTFTC